MRDGVQSWNNPTLMQRRDPDGVEFQAIADLVELRGARVVDVGCGAGRMTLPAAEVAASVYAFDPNQDRVTKARAALPAGLRGRVSFRVHGTETLDVARRRFDVALCGWSL
jgi:2-polyprenyl-3-methyl-5-hydroxy-6-metoxy-1,4-benzoquinol methylase